VRQQLDFADVWLSYNDFHLPRYIDPYIRASERWLAREVQAMRHSPAYDGNILYDEMYRSGVSGLVPWHQKYFGRIREEEATKALGQSPAQIEKAFDRFTRVPPAQRDPEALEQYLALQYFRQHGWADYVNRVLDDARPLAPRVRFGTYLRTWAAPGENDVYRHGYPPDLFAELDIVAHVHYADNSTAWVSIPTLARILGSDSYDDKTLYINAPVTHEHRTNYDGQYQRHMAFAFMSQGANGVCLWGLPHSFEDAANPLTAKGRETTAHLNREILQPFGEIIDRTDDGYAKVGIVSTFNQIALERLAPNMTEGIMVACWRLGYPPRFVREAQLADPKSLLGYEVLFVPAVRYRGTFSEAQRDALRQAIQAGVRVVTEQGSSLDLPGVTHLADWQPNSYYVGEYFPTWCDDELNKVYEKSQPIVDYLGPSCGHGAWSPRRWGRSRSGPAGGTVGRSTTWSWRISTTRGIRTRSSSRWPNRCRCR